MAEAVHDRWLPSGTRVGAGIVLGHVVAAGPDWQVAKMSSGGQALIIKEGLKDRWVDAGMLEPGHLVTFDFGADRFNILDGGAHHQLTPLSRCTSPGNRSEAMAFAEAMTATRLAGETASLAGGIYIERLSRILPIYADGCEVCDAMVLGAWLTGGVPVDARSPQLGGLLSWISPAHLRDVVVAAGVEAATSDPARGDMSLERSDINVDGKQFSLPGRRTLETFFNDHVIDVIQNRERYRALGILHPPSIVLAGPPGCGKTVAVEKLVEYLEWPSHAVQADSIASPYIHETSRKISELFQRAIDTAPAILVIDEMDAFLAERDAVSAPYRTEEIAEFLRRIPEAAKAGVIVIGMTNRLDVIDPAILRRGRFDHVLHVDYASAPEVTDLLTAMTTGLPVAADVDLARLGSELAGRPLSDAAFVIREGARLAARKRSAEIDSDSLAAALATVLAKDASVERRAIGFIR